jgi:large repetitive protein
VVSLSGKAFGGSGFYVWNWEPNQLLLNSNIYNPVTYPLSVDTSFVLNVLDLNTGCFGSDTMKVMLGSAIPPPVANTDYDTTVVNTQVIVFVLQNDIIQPGTQITVSFCDYPKHGVVILNSDNTFSYTPYPDYTGDDVFCYKICDNNSPVQCDTAYVWIHINPRNIDDIDPTGVITPNGDGSNADWIIRGIEDYPDNHVLIFNRWGDYIREFDGYDNRNKVWNGTNNNFEPVPDGTYYYIIKIANVGAKSGWFFVRNNNK